MLCQSCGNELKRGDHYCPNCGTHTDDGIPVAAIKPEPIMKPSDSDAAPRDEAAKRRWIVAAVLTVSVAATLIWGHLDLKAPLVAAQILGAVLFQLSLAALLAVLTRGVAKLFFHRPFKQNFGRTYLCAWLISLVIFGLSNYTMSS